MNQLQQFKLRVDLDASIKRLEKETEELTRLAATLPYCPCCPGSNGLCLIDWLRRRDATADIESLSQQTGISQEHINAAVALEYTFTEEEKQALCDWLDKCNEAMKQARLKGTQP